ncbi:unnamed protein product, partial [Heterosigma akashiwo]
PGERAGRPAGLRLGGGARAAGEGAAARGGHLQPGAALGRGPAVERPDHGGILPAGRPRAGRGAGRLAEHGPGRGGRALLHAGLRGLHRGAAVRGRGPGAAGRGALPPSAGRQPRGGRPRAGRAGEGG